MFVRVKKIGAYEYLYLVENAREDGRHVQRGFVLAPVPVAPVNEADTVLLPEGLNALKRMARLTDPNPEGSYLNLDGGFDSRHNRKAIFNAGLVPNIKENLRNRKAPKRGRKRLFNAAVHSCQRR